MAAAAFFVVQIEQQLSTRRDALRAFDQHARETSERLADLRAAQQAYVAEGQGVAFWVPRVAALVTEASTLIDHLRESAGSSNARGLLMEAAAAVTEFGNVDKRARDYVKSGQTLMAGDVVFSEGGDTASSASRLVESARLAETQALDASEAALRRQQAVALGAAAAVGVLCVSLLAFAAPRQRRDEQLNRTIGGATQPTGELMLRSPSLTPRSVPRGSVPLLKAAAELCTEFGRVNDRGDLPRLMARAADVLDASGLIVWLGSLSGDDLRPVLAHGYAEQMLARMPAVGRTADNAAAAAYRTGVLQIVMKRPGGSNGAVVAPLLSPEGCVGALTAEIVGGSETSEGVQAVAALLAAQITGLIAGLAPAAQLSSETVGARTASA